ncbi:NADH dehydrogenase [ubiquinone] 1 beta subcomplex subunit 2, mitochondrial-like [Haliotis cracherodii]|uniref:NADH dehydrogenase [ubiquinone] 1 beta subcomplex subunit 2, mitochondrial-like n=1 Tax=Haliotis rufescens TaxID=6454 RepID=UPI001EAFF50B|nr:NADH dehydrogenase [ubiquinone] 1 beta subcomplex subunit 2, mitochondrial-like [Haliotis rufescens]
MYFLSRLRTAGAVFKSTACKQIVPVRHGGQWVYRSLAAPASRKTLIKAEIVGFALWYWVLYHLITEPDHLYGHFEYPDPSKWTDEELGIPPE